MISGFFKDVSWVFQECFKGNFEVLLRVFQRYFNRVWDCFKFISKVFRGIFRVFQSCLNGKFNSVSYIESTVFQKCLMDI